MHRHCATTASARGGGTGYRRATLRGSLLRLHTQPAPGEGAFCRWTPPPTEESSVGLSSVSASLNSSDSPISLMLILCPFCWLHIPLFSSKYHSPFSFHIPPCPQALITLLKIMLRIACLFLTWLLSLRPACKLPAGHPHLDALLT